MATSIGKLSKSFFLKLLVGIIILPFVFWGMGDVFRGGNQNVIATIDSKKVSTQDFLNYVNHNNSYNPHIMFIAKPEIANNWFIALFEWLSRCEEIFGFDKLKGYDTTRLYAYLSERYLSFWFKKYTKYLQWPWTFFDFENQNT